jgi:CIC family chloride channel protein
VKLPPVWKLSILKRLLKDEITEDRTFFALTLIVGVAAGLIAVLINHAVHQLVDFAGTGTTFNLRTFAIGAVFVFISGYITTRKFPGTSGSGIPGVRAALAVFHGKITWNGTIAKFVTSILSLGSGMSLGREGPTVSIAAGIGSGLGSFFHLSKRKVKSLVAIGTAGGIAAAFNTPISAVLFTLEEVVGDLNAKVLGPIIISSVIAAVTANVVLGDKHETFLQIHYLMSDYREIFLFIGLGIVSAMLGPIWVKSVLALRKFNLNLFKGHKLTIIMTTFFIMGLLSLYNPGVLGSGHANINNALLGLYEPRTLVTLFLMKFFATSLCYSSGISGGLFMPTLMMGSLLGGIVGHVCSIFFPELTASTGTFALIGMGSFFVSVIRTPFTSIIMIFELTRNYNIILPLMVANITSYVISSRIESGSIYEKISEQDGIHLPTREDDEILEGLHIEDAMIKEPLTLNIDLLIKDAHEQLKDQNINGYPLLKNGVLVGMVSTNEIKSSFAKGFSENTLEKICTKNVIKIYPDQSLLVAFHRLKKHQISRLPVVSRLNDKRLVGIITAEDIVNKFGYHVIEDADDNQST